MSCRCKSLIPAIALLVIAGAVPRSTAATCESLQILQLPDTTISLAKSYAKGDTITGSTKAPVDLCRVTGTITPTSDSKINFEVWMPTSNWTGRYVQVGNSAWAGSIVYSPLSVAVSNKDAAASTDDGSSQPAGQPPASFALNHPERVKDYGFRAVHLTRLNAKTIVNAFYGQAPRFSYFRGCSKGGQESLMEAQRFPDDFDGILGGAAVSNFTAATALLMWTTLQVADGSNPGFLPTAKLAALGAAASAQCAGAKLVPTDNFFNDPRQCHFNPQVLLCSGAPDDNCLTQPQIDAVEAVLAGPMTMSGRIAPGFQPEFAAPGEWAGMITQPNPTPFGGTFQGLMALSFFANLMPAPGNGPDSFDINSSPFDVTMQLGSILNAADPDLRKFRQRGGKLIQYHGWADAVVPPQYSVDYFRTVVEFNDKFVHPDDPLQDTRDFFRLFMVPGMGHCGSGPGLSSVNLSGSGPADSDMFSALEKWVEEGVAPDKIVATGGAAGNTFTRPLCPYPQKAQYTSGDPASADSFVCSDLGQR